MTDNTDGAPPTSGANAESAKPSARGSWFGAIGAALWGSASSGASPARNASKRASMPSTSSSSSAQQPSSQAAAAADGGGADTGLNGVAKRHSAPESTLRGTPNPLAAANAALDALASGMGGSSNSSGKSGGNNSSGCTTTATASAKSSSTSSTRSKSGMASKGSRSEGLDDEERALRKSEHVTLGDFNRIKVLGKGSFGKVVLVERKGGSAPGARYAMKVLKKSKLRRAKQVERTKTERRVLEICDGHPFIMSMFYAFQTEEKLFIVLEYCSGGELFFHLSRFRKFPEHVARFYAAELVNALDFLHRHGVIYRDMKPENVLLSAEGHVKLGDFGLAKDNIWSAVQGAKSICGTPEYMAPEVLNKVGHGHAVDWWGLGMILYEMLTGLPPWYTKDRQKLFQRLRYAPLRIPPTMSIECASLVSAFLCRNPAERLGADGADGIKAHPFFNPSRPGGSRDRNHSGAGGGAESDSSDSNSGSLSRGGGSEGGKGVAGADFNWAELEARAMKPPIDPMEGVVVANGEGDDRDNTANFDPQFTKLEVDTDVEGENEEKFEHFDGFSFAGTGDFEEDNSDEEEDDDEVYDHDGGDSKDGGGSDRGGDNEGSEKQKKKGNKGGHGRKRNSEGDDANEGDVFVDPGTGNTVEAMDEQIRKLSSASGQSLNGNKSGSGSLQDSLGALPFGSGLLDAQGKPLANFNRSPSGSSESVNTTSTAGTASTQYTASTADTQSSWVSDASSIPPPPPPEYPHPDDALMAELSATAAQLSLLATPRASNQGRVSLVQSTTSNSADNNNNDDDQSYVSASGVSIATGGESLQSAGYASARGGGASLAPSSSNRSSSSSSSKAALSSSQAPNDSASSSSSSSSATPSSSSSSSSSSGGKRPSRPMRAAPPPAGTSPPSLDIFVTCKMCGIKVAQTMDAIEAHVCKPANPK